jgi:transcription antitermination protein NusB
MTGRPAAPAREAALQMLYQWEVGGARRSDCEVASTYVPRGAEARTLDEPLRGHGESRSCGARSAPRPDRPADRGARAELARRADAVVDRLILRLAVYELLETPATPRAVVINEALELARTFSGDDRGQVRQRRARRPCGARNAGRPRRNPMDTHDAARRPSLIDNAAQRRATSRSSSRSASIPYPHAVRPHRHDRRARRGARRRNPARSSRPPPSARVTAGRVLAIRSFGKANFLVLSDGARASRSTSARTRCRSATSRSSSCSTSATSSASRGGCSGRRPTS